VLNAEQYYIKSQNTSLIVCVKANRFQKESNIEKKKPIGQTIFFDANCL